MKAVNLVVTIILMFCFVSIVVSNSQAEPKYLEKKEVGKVMMEWNKALGVKCDFCHTKNAKQTYKDLAGKTADKKELSALVHQRIARAMLGNMLYLNKKEGKNYTCNTCHQGKAEVEVK